MFDIGFAEMLIIGIVALLVIGPERLPAVARKAGTYFARLRRFVTNVRADVEREFRTDELQRILQQQQDELQSLKDAVNETRKDADLESIEASVKEAVEQVNADDSSAADTPSSSKEKSDP
jgi:sec-independent protein translocase protein TatB